MIKSITLKNIATYEDDSNFDPSLINYFYGSNGTGKTSLSKLISLPGDYPSCTVQWENQEIERVVYNRDFVKENFGTNAKLNGIFTLGKDTTEEKKFIEESRQKIQLINRQNEGNKTTLGKKQANIETLNFELQEDCWKIKKEYENEFRIFYEGNIRSKEVFKNKIVDQISSVANLLTLEELKIKINKLYTQAPLKYNLIDKIEYQQLVAIENMELLKQAVIGKDDSPIAGLISKLNNSDWVVQGSKYLQNSEGRCPFCQQILPSDFASKIENYFDETYKQSCEELDNLKFKFIQETETFVKTINSILTSEIHILDKKPLTEILKLIEEMIKTNILLIDEKILQPSKLVNLEKISEKLEEINSFIEIYNLQINDHNKIIDNLEAEKEILVSEIWRFNYEQVRVLVGKWQASTNGHNRAIISLRKSISDKEKEVRDLEKIIKEKENAISSITFTVNEINKILELYGFDSFRLAEANITGEKGYYRIIRGDGSDAKETLSEGEYTFITFLYFYHLIRGSNDASRINREKIIVIDDPISSLDSNVLFIISNLVKNIIKDCLNSENGIKQVFLLTHNVYFHKEVTFRGNRENPGSSEAYYVIKKINNLSGIVKHEKNPISTTYELLWREMDDVGNISKVTVFNTMRRILEYYFNIVGGLNYEVCINQFDGEEKLVCKTLISWINDGSHFINDDLEICIDSDGIEKYLSVFELIFQKMGHESHYKMMKRI